MLMNSFNAIKYIGELREAGVPEKQAEVHLRILHEVIESNLATKRDIEEVKRDIEELRSELKRDIKELEQRMTIKLGALIVVTIGVIVALSNIKVI